jgi:hypothetical protein
MASGSSSWKRDVLLIPLVVAIGAGLVVWAAGYSLPKLFEKGKRISYTIDGPTAYVNPSAANTVKITVGGVETPNIYGYKVRLRNSGSVPLKTLPVQFWFETPASEFAVFNVTHETVPKKEFGKIEEIGSDKSSKRFVYELLNPSDEDILTFLTNVDAKLFVFTKAENLKTEFIEPKAQPRKWLWVFQWLSVALVASGSLATSLSLAAVRKKQLGKRFALIDSLADELHKQYLILMAETGREITRSWQSYIYEFESGGAGSGHFDMQKFKDAFYATGFISVGSGGDFLAITEEGKKFAEWLVANHRKADFFDTPFGGWGKAKPGGVAQKWLDDRKAKQQPARGDLEKPPETDKA